MRELGLFAAQPRVYASVNWAKLITCKMAGLPREGQLRGSGIPEDDGWADMRTLRGGSFHAVSEAYHNPWLMQDLQLP